MANNPLSHIINDITAQLQPLYPESAEQHAWWLLMAVTMQTREQLLAQPTLLLSDHHKTTLTHYINQLVHLQMPFAYVVGSVPFGNLEILIEPPILIPRPETEEWCIELAQKLQQIPGPLTILDMCTGSGCIALTLAQALPHATVYGVDINKDALALAQKNAMHNKITNVTWVLSDLFDQLDPNLRFDLIVSNPPYISESEWHTLDPQVKNWEDVHALLAPQEGLGVLDRLIHQAPAWLRPNKTLPEKGIARKPE